MNAADTSTVSEAYGKMLTIFIPLLVDEVEALVLHVLDRKIIIVL